MDMAVGLFIEIRVFICPGVPVAVHFMAEGNEDGFSELFGAGRESLEEIIVLAVGDLLEGEGIHVLFPAPGLKLDEDGAALFGNGLGFLGGKMEAGGEGQELEDDIHLGAGLLGKGVDGGF